MMHPESAERAELRVRAPSLGIGARYEIERVTELSQAEKYRPPVVCAVFLQHVEAQYARVEILRARVIADQKYYVAQALRSDHCVTSRSFTCTDGRPPPDRNSNTILRAI